MIKNIIKYGVLALVLIGIIVVMSNLFTSDTEWKDNGNGSKTTKNSYYSAKISLLDKETGAFISGANLVVKDNSGTIISGWTTEDGVHLITNLKKGTYTLVQEETTSNYHLNNDVVTFKIKDQDEEVVMYNIKMTEEEKKNMSSSSNIVNGSSTRSDEVGVENTLSVKNTYFYVISAISIFIGMKLIFCRKGLKF